MGNDGGYWQGYPDNLRSRGSALTSRGDAAFQGGSTSQGAFSQQAEPEQFQHNQAHQQDNQAKPSTTPYAQAYTSGRSHVVAGLLAIFLGSFGIHKFYLGYNTVGFIMLAVTILGSVFTFGLAGSVMCVIGIVEGIIYLATGQQTFDRTYVFDKKEWF